MATIEERAEKWVKEYMESEEFQYPLYERETVNSLIVAYLAGAKQAMFGYIVKDEEIKMNLNRLYGKKMEEK